MREIKFRSWDKEFKKFSEKALMYSISDINFLTDYKWMQYTGLKDKNGKEIYEGDILEYYEEPNTYRGAIDEALYGKKTTKVIVDFIDGAFVITNNNLISSRGNYWRLIGEYVAVIGNIYENPELLEV